MRPASLFSPPMDLPIRPRRNRRTAAVRDLVRETELGPGHLIYPLFVHAGAADQPIASMPGCTRWSLEGLVREAGEAHALGVPGVVLFPAVADALKTRSCDEAWNPGGLVPRAVRALKEALPSLAVITDVALDPYNADGHDGLVADDGRILNDETVEALCRQALCHARAGADVVAPSDMMDGRVAAIRAALDGEGFTELAILAYTAKYASAYYGPFRGALDSAPRFGDKKTYQMDPANAEEALREVELDLAEGADSVMVKPGLPYLDIVRRVKEAFEVPVFAYQVSGEYAMIEHAAAAGAGDRDALVLETLLAFKRAGCSGILTYHAAHAARLLGA